MIDPMHNAVWRLDRDLAARLKSLSEQTRVPRSVYVREAVDDLLKERPLVHVATESDPAVPWVSVHYQLTLAQDRGITRLVTGTAIPKRYWLNQAVLGLLRKYRHEP